MTPKPTQHSSFTTTLLVVLALTQLSSAYTTKYTWMSIYDPASRDQYTAKQTLNTLKGLGVTKVYVDVWNNGNLYARSGVYNRLMGYGSNPNPDHLSNVLQAAQAVGGIDIVAWFEYGVMGCYTGSPCQYGNIARSKGWMLGTDGEFTWLNPSNSQFTSFLSSMINDVKTGYSQQFACFKGVQVDDHFSVPSGLYFDGADQAMTSLATLISNTIGSEYFSIAPATMPLARDDHSVDWPSWMNSGLFYEVVPQIYTESSSSFANGLNVQLQYFNDPARMGAGIRCAGGSGDTPAYSVKDQISYAESSGVKAAAIWEELCFMKEF